MTEFLEDMQFTYSSRNGKMQNAKMYSWPPFHRNTGFFFFYNAINSCSGYFKIRNSPMKLDCVGFKDVCECFSFYCTVLSYVNLMKRYLSCLRISSSEQLLGFYFMEPELCNDNCLLFTLTVRKL